MTDDVQTEPKDAVEAWLIFEESDAYEICARRPIEAAMQESFMRGIIAGYKIMKMRKR